MKRHGDTAFAASKTGEVKALRERLERVARTTEKRIASLFRGKLLSADLKAGTIALEYDFKNREQLKDFPGARTNDREGGPNIGSLHIPWFAWKKDFRLRLEYRGASPCESGWIYVAFGKAKGWQKNHDVVFSADRRLSWFARRTGMLNHAGVLSKSSQVVRTKAGVFEIVCRDGLIKASLNGGKALTYKYDGRASPGVHLGTGSTGWLPSKISQGLGAYFVRVVRLRISGKLKTGWLKTRLTGSDR
jgi:hypothetical protein